MQARRPTKDEITRLIRDAIAQHRAGRPDRAVAQFESIAPLVRKDAEALRYYSVALIGIGKVSRALTEIDRAIKLRPMQAQYRVDRARLLTMAGRYEEALLDADRALAIEKGSVAACHARVMALRRLGRSAEAYAWLRPMLAGHTEPDVLLVDALAELSRETENPAEVASILKDTLSREITPEMRQALQFKLGEILDREGRYDEAFSAISEANANHRVAFDAGLHRRQTRKLIESWKDGVTPRPVHEDAEPIFVVGLPRSGTSLVEQILSTHSAVASAGETVETIRAAKTLGVRREPYGYVFSLESVGEQDLVRVSGRMVRHLAQISGGKDWQRLTDKMPENVMHIGFLATLFPRARFVHCLRDLRDTCLSCFFQDFSGALHYAFDLEACASYAADVIRHSEHWKQIEPERIHTVRYRDLVHHHEETVRALLAFLGLEFEVACLSHDQSDRSIRTASFEQANQPIYTSSVGRWQHYEQHLGPVMDVLKHRGIRLD